MKKVGIITFHRAVNYGACLQTYALKEALSNLGVNVEIIDYRSSDVEGIYRQAIRKGAGIKTILKNMLTWSVQKRRNQAFLLFLENYVLRKGAKSFYQPEELEALNQEYDIFISGSDQVWSPLCTANDKTYMLDFVKDESKKYSYAASFGVVDEQYLCNEEIRQLLQSYAFLSVREQKGLEIIHSMLGENVKKNTAQHIDPTFLLEKDKWTTLTRSVEKDKYVFIYSLSMPSEVIEYAEKVAAEKHLQVKCFTLNNLYAMLHPTKVINGSPLDFLSYIANAEYVVTNSFHGTAFSIIFNKNFSVVKNVNPNHDNSRLTNILNMLGLEDRLVVENEVFHSLKPINYARINQRVMMMRHESMEYLKKITK